MRYLGNEVVTARGWRGRKYYLSDEAVALLVAHCNKSRITMSSYIDQMIKDQLDPAAAEAKRVLEEGARQIAELTAQTWRDRGVTPADPVAEEKVQREKAFQEHEERERKSKQPTKKDFDIDL